MEIRDPKLYDAIMNLPNSFELYKTHANQRLDKIEEQIEDLRYTDLTNGDGKRIKTAKLIPAMYRDVQEIKQATDILLDFAKLHRIFKKWKVYWATLIVMIGWQTGQPILQVIKEIVK